jgi:m7GpppX diphosphatase
VSDILSGAAEASAVLFADPDPEHGFVLLPDMKWDGRAPAALYLLALARAPGLRSLRDLRRAHLPLLTAVRATAARVAAEKWGLPHGALRMFVHYQPSYCMCARCSSRG